MIEALSAQVLTDQGYVSLFFLGSDVHVFGQQVHVVAHGLESVDRCQREVLGARQVHRVAKVSNI